MVNQRRALELLWTDTCSILGKVKTTDPKTKVTSFSDAPLAEGVRCRLSFSSYPPAGEGNVATVTQTVKLFLGNEVEVPAGAKIVVARNGRTTTYCRAGEPAVFHVHQEVPLELWKERA